MVTSLHRGKEKKRSLYPKMLKRALTHPNLGAPLSHGNPIYESELFLLQSCFSCPTFAGMFQRQKVNLLFWLCKKWNDRPFCNLLALKVLIPKAATMLSCSVNPPFLHYSLPNTRKTWLPPGPKSLPAYITACPWYVEPTTTSHRKYYLYKIDIFTMSIAKYRETYQVIFR